MAEAQVDTIRLKLFRIGALVRISARRVWLEMNSFYPWKHIYARLSTLCAAEDIRRHRTILFHIRRQSERRSYAPTSNCGAEKNPFAQPLERFEDNCLPENCSPGTLRPAIPRKNQPL
ncbi:MAG: hypothetical protein ACYCSN_15795 [Acidobacteriaceae bacterium]